MHSMHSKYFIWKFSVCESFFFKDMAERNHDPHRKPTQPSEVWDNLVKAKTTVKVLYTTEVMASSIVMLG